MVMCCGAQESGASHDEFTNFSAADIRVLINIFFIFKILLFGVHRKIAIKCKKPHTGLMKVDHSTNFGANLLNIYGGCLWYIVHFTSSYLTALYLLYKP